MRAPFEHQPCVVACWCVMMILCCYAILGHEHSLCCLMKVSVEREEVVLKMMTGEGCVGVMFVSAI